MNRIVCVGNSLVAADAAGPRVLDVLRRRPLPAGVELVDGGLGGLGLLGALDGADRVVLVDRVEGFDDGEAVVVVEAQELASLATTGFDHGAGLPYLVRILPSVCERSVPWVVLVGIEDPDREGVDEAAADLAVRLATGGAP